ncbi:MAG: VWA domain-containing protein [Chloroflexota bacterium]|nr:VWA domain-containing protein [Chloroflexota bacterium]
MNFTARADRRYIRTTYRSNRFVLVEIVAPSAHVERPRPPVNLAFVLDRSGSMAGEKIRLARHAVEQSVARLHPTDRFAVVAYDNEVDVVFPSTPATPEARRTALARLAELDARGSTDLAGGWLRGCEQVGLHLAADGINGCLLLTDGLANVGITDRDELANHAAALLARGVSTTTFGVGADFDEVLLQAMATAGGGNFYYIESGAQIADYVTSEVGEALEVVARDVTLSVTAAESVSVESLSPFPFERHGARTVVNLGSLVAEQVLHVVLRLNFPYGEVGRETGAIVTLADRDGVFEGAVARLAWEYADGPTNDMQPRDRDVDRAVARVFAARARQEATALNRSGNYPAAQAAMAAVANRIRKYADADTELNSIVASLEGDARTLAAPMAAAALKSMHFAGYAAARMRAPDGRAMRSRK